MTAVTAVRFDVTNITAGTAAIASLAFQATDKIAFSTVGNEMIVFRIPM